MEEANLNTIQKELREGFGKVDERIGKVDENLGRLGKIETNIESIHSDLIAHDERTEKIIGEIQTLSETRRLPEKVEKMREVIKEKLGVEV
ncbi:MAG: hypothetical protein G01um101424_365 [Parcubacteria group bacterium Gr01-1014_24]|nr:MAG: hypothetical protein G01um101424_365 [Parcubacteria group bacterium Gr01-1014_24]